MEHGLACDMKKHKERFRYKLLFELSGFISSFAFKFMCTRKVNLWF